MKLIERPRRALDAMRARRARAAGQTLPHALRHREVERAHHHALFGYRPGPGEGRLVLFRAPTQTGSATQQQTLGWSDYMQGGVEVIELPGDRDRLLERPALLGELRAVLKRAQAEVAPDGFRPGRR